jgi:hypothetical protein
MRGTPRQLWSLLAVCGLAWTLVSCSGQVELRPELQAHLDEYEGLIETYEVKLAEVRSDPPKFAKVASSYSREVKTWMGQWDTEAPNMSDEEGRAVKAQIDRLNKRAARMLTSG